MAVELFMVLPATGKTIKARTNSLALLHYKLVATTSYTATSTRPKQTKQLDFQLHNSLKFKQEGSGIKNLDGLQKFINFAV
ncbi:MAG: hypothetical protein ACI9Q9_001366 [Flavobacterium sp.]|jgi:hypothetical protein